MTEHSVDLIINTVKCSIYWRAHVRDLQLHALNSEQQSTEMELLLSHSAVISVNKDKVDECTDTWYKQIQPTETVEL